MKQQPIKKVRPSAPREYGVHLDVLGRALIKQADERIQWHERTVAVMAEEIRTLISNASEPDGADELRRRFRRTDLERQINGHREYARFLAFVRDNLVSTRRYRLALTDLSTLEITPRGIY